MGRAAHIAFVVLDNTVLSKIRQFAQRAGVPVIGSVGILIRSVQKELLSLHAAQGLLDRMVAAGYRSPINRLDDLM